MQSLWNKADAARCANELELRAYSSRLLGSDPSLVLHGGGNTSIKLEQNGARVLYVKGTGSDLARVDAQAFAPLWLDEVNRLLEHPPTHNAEMMLALDRCRVRHPAPRPSIETLMHAGLPFRCVEHTHADAVLAAMNVEDMAAVHAEIYSDVAPLVAYHHSGHALARACLNAFHERGTKRTIGLILAFHGVVAFGDDLRSAHENMIKLVTCAEHYLQSRGAWALVADTHAASPADLRTLEGLRSEIDALAGRKMEMLCANDARSTAFARRVDLQDVSQHGPATPQHAVYTRRVPMIGRNARDFADGYRAYLGTHLDNASSRLMDAAPRVLLDPEFGVCTFDASKHMAQIAMDMYQHDIAVISRASAHGRYRSAPPAAMAQAEFEYGGYAARQRKPVT